MGRTVSDEVKQADAFKVGSIWYASWGYDQTNVDYFQVVRESPSSVWLRGIGSHVEDGRLYPDPDRFLGDNVKGHLHRKNGWAENGVNSPGRVTLALSIDYVRTAFPYTGGGKYDTRAAGQEGH